MCCSRGTGPFTQGHEILSQETQVIRPAHIEDFVILVCRPVESHSGARGNIFAGPQNIFTGPLFEDNF